MSPDDLIDTLIALDALADLPRTGWLLRGVAQPESIAAHSHGVALVTMALIDAARAENHEVDGERALRIALLHDAPEARTGDIPMPQKTPAMSAALTDLEAAVAASILPTSWAASCREAEECATLEARIAMAADKIHLMIKVICYETKRAAHLADFWANPGNFQDRDLPFARAVFDAIRARAPAGGATGAAQSERR
jgi:putative hydrolases of HD superfamily